MSSDSPTNGSAAKKIAGDILSRLESMSDWELKKVAHVLGIKNILNNRVKWSSNQKHNEIADETIQETYLRALEVSGRYAWAAEAAGVSYEYTKLYRREYPEFQAKCDAALEAYRDNIIIEAHRRAVGGYQVPIIGGRNKDTVVATETRYSDRLLELFLKRGANEEFSDKMQVTVDGVPIREQMNLASLSPRARAKLRELLEILKEEEEEKLLAARNVIDADSQEP